MGPDWMALVLCLIFFVTMYRVWLGLWLTIVMLALLIF